MASHLDHIVDWPDRAVKSGYSIPDLARLCRISPSQLRRYFATKFGQSPHQWLGELRLRRAVDLLRDGLTVKETAGELGYANSAHLCHRFKERHGCAPLEFASAAKSSSLIYEPLVAESEKCANQAMNARLEQPSAIAPAERPPHNGPRNNQWG